MVFPACVDGDISLVLPLLGTSGIFVVLTSFLFSPEHYSVLGIIGIFSIAIGVYLLGPDLTGKKLYAPWKLLKFESVRLALAVSFLGALDGQFLKRAALVSSWSFVLYISSIVVAAYFWIRMRSAGYHFPTIRNLKQFKHTAGLGLCGAGSLSFVLMAFSMPTSNVAYIISLKRLSILFGLAAGKWHLSEKITRLRLIASFLILGGAFIIALSK